MIKMVDFDRLEEKSLEGFGAGAVSFAILEAISYMGHATAFLGTFGYVFLAGLSVLGIVVGLGKPKEAEKK